MNRTLAGLMLCIACFPLWVRAEVVDVALLTWHGAPEYHPDQLWARALGAPTGTPEVGAEVAQRESSFPLKAIGMELKLHPVVLQDPGEAAAQLDRLVAEGLHYVLLDLPARIIADLAQSNHQRDLLLFNISARDDRLRGEWCQPNLLHTIPAYAMRHDALAQYLVSRKWRRILLLEGPLPEDRVMADSFVRSSKRHGLKLIARRQFVVSNDPRERDKANVSLLSSGDYDVVFVADSEGEFARTVPYATLAPRPVVGGEGFAASAWHWSWERHGAPQLTSRFEKRAKRRMGPRDWAAWIAIKGLTEAMIRTRSTALSTVSAYLQGDEIVIDGFKGNRVSFRAWDGQLRQPMLLHTHNQVIERTPLAGFLHRHNNLDTVGTDEAEGLCINRGKPDA